MLMTNQPFLRNGPWKLPNSAKKRKLGPLRRSRSFFQGHRFWYQ